MPKNHKLAKNSFLFEELKKRYNDNEFKNRHSIKKESSSHYPPDIRKDEVVQKLTTDIVPHIKMYMEEKLPKHISFEATFANLMQELGILMMTEYETVYALFLWLCNQDFAAIQSADFPDDIDEDTPMGYFREILYRTKNFTDLFSRLMKEANIPCEEIWGYIKTPSWFPDHEFMNTHDENRDKWNVVFIDSHWRFIDIRRALPPMVFDADSNGHKKFDDFYFLTDPCKLINTHFSDDKTWQLLPSNEIVSIEEFSSAPKKFPHFYEGGISLPEEQGALIQVENGLLHLEFEVEKEKRKSESYRFELVTRNKMCARINDQVLNRFIYHQVAPTKDLVDVYFPKAGKYLLEVYLMNYTEEGGVFNLVTFYQLNCLNVPDIYDSILQPPFPKVAHAYGLTPEAFIRNISVSFDETIIFCDEKGEAKIEMFYSRNSLNGKEVVYDFAANIFTSASPPNKPVHDRILQSCTQKVEKNHVKFLVRAPSSGYSTCVLYICNNPDKSPLYKELARYLINNNMLGDNSVIQPNFPSSLKQGRVGPVQAKLDDLKCKLYGVEPNELNHNVDESWIKASNFGEIMFCFYHEQQLRFMVGNIKGDDSVQTMIESTSSFTCITSKCIVVNEESKELVYKVYASLPDQSSHFHLIYTFSVQFNKTTRKMFPNFPQCPSFSWGGILNKMHEKEVKVTEFSNSQSWTHKKFGINYTKDQLSSILPCRVYSEGEDMKLTVQFSLPFAIKPILRKINQSSSNIVDFDSYVISEKSTLNYCVFRARFPEVGWFILALCSSEFSCQPEDQKFKPFYYCVINVESVIGSIKRFPTSLDLWSNTIHDLQNNGLVNHFFRLGKDTFFTIELFNIAKKGISIKKDQFKEVILIVDDHRIIQAINDPGDAEKYEFNYKPQKGDMRVAVAVVNKHLINEAIYVLKYEILQH